MAGRVYRAAPVPPPASLAREALRRRRAARTRTARRSSRATRRRAAARRAGPGGRAVADRDDEPPAVRRAARGATSGIDGRGGGRRGSRPTARPSGVADAAVADADLDRAAEPEPREPLPGASPRAPACRSIVSDRQPRAARGSPPGSRTPSRSRGPGRPARRREQLGHAGDDVRLADRLAGLDRQRLVGVGEVALGSPARTPRAAPGHRARGRARRAMPRGAELARDHRGARLCALVPLAPPPMSRRSSTEDTPGLRAPRRAR